MPCLHISWSIFLSSRVGTSTPGFVTHSLKAQGVTCHQINRISDHSLKVLFDSTTLPKFCLSVETVYWTCKTCNWCTFALHLNLALWLHIFYTCLHQKQVPLILIDSGRFTVSCIWYWAWCALRNRLNHHIEHAKLFIFCVSIYVMCTICILSSMSRMSSRITLDVVGVGGMMEIIQTGGSLGECLKRLKTPVLCLFQLWAIDTNNFAFICGMCCDHLKL